MAENAEHFALLDKVKIGKVVHIPADVFPDEEAPAEGYWVGKTVQTTLGGNGNVGILVEGEEVFTRSRIEVVDWIVAEPAPPK